MRKELARKLETALRFALPLVSSLEAMNVEPSASGAIEGQLPNRRVAIRADLAAILDELESLEPKSLVKVGLI